MDTRVARIALRLAFVAEFAALLLFGPLAMTIVATLAAVADGLADSSGSHRVRGLLLNVATAIIATQAAGFAYVTLSGIPVWFHQGPAGQLRRAVLHGYPNRSFVDDPRAC